MCALANALLGRIRLSPAGLLALAIGLSPVLPAARAAEPRTEPLVHYLRVAREPPSCVLPSGMPIIPRDPGTHLGSSGTHCSSADAAVLELWLPEERYLWLERKASNPAAWIDLGPVGANPPGLDEPPMGLRLSRLEGSFRLETRYRETATLTALEPGRWHEITSPDGERFWVWLAGGRH